MSQRNQLVVQAAQIGGLMVLFLGHVTAFSAVAADLKHSQLRHSPSSNLIAKSVPISEADAETIENWLLGDRSSYLGKDGHSSFHVTLSEFRVNLADLKYPGFFHPFAATKPRH